MFQLPDVAVLLEAFANPRFRPEYRPTPNSLVL